jgi:hypothetical protein
VSRDAAGIAPDPARRLAAFLPASAWAATLFAFSHSSSPPGAGALRGLDFPVHLAAHGLLGLLAAAGFGGAWPRWTALAAARAGALAAALHGLADEFHQSFVPGRAVEASDLVADAVGAVLGAAAWAAWRARASRS